MAITWVLIVVLVVLAIYLGQTLTTTQDTLARKEKAYDHLLQQYQSVVETAAQEARSRFHRRNGSHDMFRGRLEFLGFADYEEYLQSELWRQSKQRYYASEYPKHCLICGSPDIELHHRTYVRMGNEELFDLVPLCRKHHERLHEFLDADPELCVEDTHDCLAKLKKEAETAELPIGSRRFSRGKEES